MAEPFVYEGAIRIFDPEPGSVIYLLDHPDADEYGGPDLVEALSKHRGEGMMFLDIPGRFRITIEELDEGADATQMLQRAGGTAVNEGEPEVSGTPQVNADSALQVEHEGRTVN